MSGNAEVPLKWHFNPDTATETLIHQQAQPSFSWVKLSETWRSGMTIPRKNQKVVISGKETNCDKIRGEGQKRGQTEVEWSHW